MSDEPCRWCQEPKRVHSGEGSYHYYCMGVFRTAMAKQKIHADSLAERAATLKRERDELGEQIDHAMDALHKIAKRGCNRGGAAGSCQDRGIAGWRQCAGCIAFDGMRKPVTWAEASAQAERSRRVHDEAVERAGPITPAPPLYDDPL